MVMYSHKLFSHTPRTKMFETFGPFLKYFIFLYLFGINFFGQFAFSLINTIGWNA